MARVLGAIGVFIFAIVLSMSSLLFAGSRGWLHLPSYNVWARPVIVYFGEDRTWLASDPHNHWIITITIIDPQTPTLKLREIHLFSMPISGPFNPLPFYPPIVQLW